MVVVNNLALEPIETLKDTVWPEKFYNQNIVKTTKPNLVLLT